jgi:hypothetical protein
MNVCVSFSESAATTCCPQGRCQSTCVLRRRQAGTATRKLRHDRDDSLALQLLMLSTWKVSVSPVACYIKAAYLAFIGQASWVATCPADVPVRPFAEYTAPLAR